MSTLSRDEILRYSRHLVMPEITLAGQERLKAARVLCVGAGGLGSPLLLYLAAAGVGTIGVVEYDKVDLSNIQRQILYATSDVGRPKIEVAGSRLGALNPGIRIVPHAGKLTAANAAGIIRDYDIVADASDNFPTRYLVNDVCVLTGTPDVYASVFRFEGQLSVFDARRGPCYRCLFPEPPPPGLVPACADGGVLGVLPGILGTLQALEVIKLILGIGEPLVGRLLLVEALATSFRDIRFGKSAGCAVCGATPTVTAPVDYEAFCGIDTATGRSAAHDLPRVSVTQFLVRQRAGEAGELVDLRDTPELAIAAIPGARSLPLADLPARLHELDSARHYTLCCHRGERSVEAFYLLWKAGFRRLDILDGGIDAWAEQGDGRVARY
ncbi:MAG: molybdopterin-synthase adenylyltransferase MoeB [Gammaproteobacteria bacterium]|nr:molybdopterin-synthase adenylyltransferase MoeB [Gammaproteobacteria bacterium]